MSYFEQIAANSLPYFTVEPTGVTTKQTINSAANVLVTFGNIINASDANGAPSGWNTSTSVFTAPVTGVYFFSTSLSLMPVVATSVIANVVYGFTYGNASIGAFSRGIQALHDYGSISTNISETSVTISTTLHLQQADQLRVSIQGCTVVMGGNCLLSGHLVARTPL